MSSDTPFKPQDIKRARFLKEFISETQKNLEEVGLPAKTLELEKVMFLRGLLNHPSCSRKRREEVDEQIKTVKMELEDLKTKARTFNNELEIFKRTYMALPERLRELASKVPKG